MSGEKDMGKHTQEEWFVVRCGPENLVINRDDENRVCFMATPGVSPDDWPRIQRDAAHIVKCVNNFDALVKALEPFAAMAARPEFQTDGLFPVYLSIRNGNVQQSVIRGNELRVEHFRDLLAALKSAGGA